MSFIDIKGEQRYLGNLIPESGLVLKQSWKVYGDNVAVTPMIPRKSWMDQPLPSYRPPIVYHQRSTNMCNAFACATAVESMRRQMGLQNKRVSPAYIYGGINDGVDQGSTLEDGMARLIKNGYVFTDIVPEFNFNPNQWPEGVDNIAQTRTVTEAWLCPTFEHIASASLCGFAVVVGVFWGNRDAIDQNGWLSDDPSGGIAGGHALATFSIAKRGNRFGMKTVNSWGDEWGAAGWCILPEQRFRGPFKGAWAIRQLSIAKNDLDLPIPD